MKPRTGKTVRTVRTVRIPPGEPNPPDANRTQPGRTSDGARTQTAEQIPHARAISDGPDGSDGRPGSPTDTILAALDTSDWTSTRRINREVGFIANLTLGELHAEGVIDRRTTVGAVLWRLADEENS